jgi:outer membrane protein OmpA-like peptidoglycan-associated protein
LKRLYFIFFGLLFLTLHTYGQRDINHFQVTALGGVNYFSNDIVDNIEDENNPDFYGVGLRLQKRLCQDFQVGIGYRENRLWNNNEQAIRYATLSLGYAWDNGYLLDERAFLSPYHIIQGGFRSVEGDNTENPFMESNGFVGTENGFKFRLGDSWSAQIAVGLYWLSGGEDFDNLFEDNFNYGYQAGLSYHFGSVKTDYEGPVFNVGKDYMLQREQVPAINAKTFFITKSKRFSEALIDVPTLTIDSIQAKRSISISDKKDRNITIGKRTTVYELIGTKLSLDSIYKSENDVIRVNKSTFDLISEPIPSDEKVQPGKAQPEKSKTDSSTIKSERNDLIDDQNRLIDNQNEFIRLMLDSRAKTDTSQNKKATVRNLQKDSLSVSKRDSTVAKQDSILAIANDSLLLVEDSLETLKADTSMVSLQEVDSISKEKVDSLNRDIQGKNLAQESDSTINLQQANLNAGSAKRDSTDLAMQEKLDELERNKVRLSQKIDSLERNRDTVRVAGPGMANNPMSGREKAKSDSTSAKMRSEKTKQDSTDSKANNVNDRTRTVQESSDETNDERIENLEEKNRQLEEEINRLENQRGQNEYAKNNPGRAEETKSNQDIKEGLDRQNELLEEQNRQNQRIIDNQNNQQPIVIEDNDDDSGIELQPSIVLPTGGGDDNDDEEELRENQEQLQAELDSLKQEMQDQEMADATSTGQAESEKLNENFAPSDSVNTVLRSDSVLRAMNAGKYAEPDTADEPVMNEPAESETETQATEAEPSGSDENTAGEMESPESNSDDSRPELEADYPVEVFFGLNKSDVSSQYKPGLDQLVSDLKNKPEMKAKITGSADKSGNAAYNKKLSENRASNVKLYLVEKGISEDRIEVEALGSDKSGSQFNENERKVIVTLNE